MGRHYPKNELQFSRSPQGLTDLSDLPSSGDTSYAGIVLKDGFVYISYYTNDIQRDLILLFGMLEPSHVRMAKIELEALDKVAPNL